MRGADTAYIEKLNVTPDSPPISTSEKLLLFVLADSYNEGSGEARRGVAAHTPQPTRC